MDYAEQGNSTGRIVGVVFVLALHVLILYALVTGLARKAVESIRAPIETKIIEEVKAPPPDRPPPPPKLDIAPPPFIPPVEIRIQPPPPAAVQNAITSVTTEKPVAVSPPPPPSPAPEPVREPVRVAAVIDPATACRKPDYPAASRRFEEEGAVVVKFLVGLDGMVVESSIATSSGFQRLDDAARKALSQCKFKPATIDGKPEQGWATVRYVWKLQ